MAKKVNLDDLRKKAKTPANTDEGFSWWGVILFILFLIIII